jgi:hypothetical protein
LISRSWVTRVAVAAHLLALLLFRELNLAVFFCFVNNLQRSVICRRMPYCSGFIVSKIILAKNSSFSTLIRFVKGGILGGSSGSDVHWLFLLTRYSRIDGWTRSDAHSYLGVIFFRALFVPVPLQPICYVVSVAMCYMKSMFEVRMLIVREPEM